MIKLKIGLSLLFISMVSLSTDFIPVAIAVAPDDSTPVAVNEIKTKGKKSLGSLDKLLKTESDQKQKLVTLKKQLARSPKEEKKSIQGEIDNTQRELEELENYIESVATGVDTTSFDLDNAETFNMQSEMEELIQPLIIMMKSATDETRQIEKLKHSIVVAQHQRDIANQAIGSLQVLLEATNDKTMVKRLKKMLSAWKQRQDSTDTVISAMDHQMQSKLSSRESLANSTGKMFTSFFRDRGVNFVLGILAFVSVFTGMRLIYRLYLSIRRRGSFQRRSVVDRVIHFLFNSIAMLFAIGATLFVFNSLNDWLLLGVSLIFLLALGWIFLKMLPNFVEQLMLLLNIGAVREGERVMFNGIPWHVKSLDFFTHLENPELVGGKLKLPVRELTGLHSRPSGNREIWFPSQEGDWVELDDGKIGKVTFQSPEMVQIVELGGAKINYTTENYLNLNPRNMSSDFRVEVEFGIDYKHQDISTTEIPKAMQEKVQQGLSKIVPDNDLLNVDVEFMKADSSALVYEVEADIRGSSAHQYEQIERAMASLLVDACNERGWKIPFQQLTIHRAAELTG